MFNRIKTQILSIEIIPRTISLGVVLFILTGLLTGCEKFIPYLKGEHNGEKCEPGPAQLLATGIQGASGSAVGPGNMLYVTEGAVGKISRIDPETGDKTTYTEGLPASIVGIGGVDDVAFVGDTAYALVTLVDDPALFPTGQVNGIYRVDGPNSHTVIADIGAYNIANPPEGFDFFISTGVQYSIQKYKDGFLVSDGHLNRVLQVSKDGDISIFKSFGNIVPTGMALRGDRVFMAEAGSTPHLPEDGKVVSFNSKSSIVSSIASGGPLMVDVAFNRGNTLYALSQGIWDGVSKGSPAEPNTGSLLRVNFNGTLTPIVEELDRPTSLEFIKNTAYVVSLAGEVWTIEDVGFPCGI